MKKIRMSEGELVDLIEKLVKENLSNGNAQNLGMMNTPTAKYKDLLEKEDIEEDNGEEEQLNVNVTNQPGSDDEDAWMEGLEESKLISRLKKNLTEAEGKGCAESEGGSGCIKKRGDGWVILNNKKGGVWRKCTSEKDCQEQLDAFHANK
jgi:hypothetical protein|tara:strand:- start:642 stop:1091 length:450 start_codon:yes stop_codon:yes gene_type:complete